MQNLDKQVSQRLNRLYLVALSVVAILSLLGQILIQQSLNNSIDDSHVVNLAGRQRMLSQRICKISILLVKEKQFKEEITLYKQEFNEIIDLWIKCHYGLKNGKLITDKTYNIKNSKEIQTIFNDIEPYFKSLSENAKLISNNFQLENESEILKKILSDERKFLKLMDKIVLQYDTEAQARVKNVKQIEFIVFFLTLFVLILEAFLIFTPLVQYVKNVILRLTESELELQYKNQQLNDTNEKLVSTQKDLLKTSEEKYALLRQEDNVRSASLIEGQEEERKRLARELHDGIGQMLTGLKLDSEQLKSLPFINEKQRKSFEEHKKLIDETIEATRTVSFNLMPSVLTDFGLPSAVRLLIERIAKGAGFQASFNDFTDNIDIPNKIENNLYRITQEALNNIVKHAKARKVAISLSNEKNKFITLSIIDDGKGFDQKKVRKAKFTGNGLGNLQTRVRLLDGTIKIESEMNKGTSIFVKIPITKKELRNNRQND